MTRTKTPQTLLLAAMLMSLIGCEKDEKERLVQMATEAADRQAGQNQEMSRLNREVAGGTKRLVEEDAQARRELAQLQRDLRNDQAEVARQRDLLEGERRDIANQRARSSVMASCIKYLGLTVACLAPLALAAYALSGLRREPAEDARVTEILIEELATGKPLLLPGPGSRRAIRKARNKSPGNDALDGDHST